MSYEPQTAKTWRKLAQTCAKGTMKKLDEKLKESGGNNLGPRECAIIEAMIFGVIIGAYHNVAEEAVEGVDVTGALHAGDV